MGIIVLVGGCILLCKKLINKYNQKDKKNAEEEESLRRAERNHAAPACEASKVSLPLTMNGAPQADQYNKKELAMAGKLLARGRLTANSGADAQENISALSDGDEVYVEYDYEKDRYEVHEFDYIGCLPKHLVEYAGTAIFRVLETGGTGSGRLYVVVGAYEN
ncbi:MAG: hypothetical protein ACOX62_04890 [Christensenellales bacterium]|jgi:hypothetical protein